MLLEENSKNVLVSVVCGAIFGFAWWLMIDIFAYYPETIKYRNGLLLAPAILSTASLIGNNVIPNVSLAEHFTVTRTIICHRMAFFFTMAFGFAGLLVSIIMCAIAPSENFPLYARIGIPIQNCLILTSNLLFKFATTDGSEDSI